MTSQIFTFPRLVEHYIWRVSSFLYSNEVRDALDNKRPIVALESTIISHGLPRPD
ncbi:MAG: pseudouridine-5'-phosphate glycosidase, partial [Candidatus Nanopelagicales bacterium]